MNYLIMKSIIDATISHFQCKACHNTISERDVTIVDSGAHGVNMEVRCSHCQEIAQVKAEINVINSSADLEKITETSTMIAKMMNFDAAQMVSQGGVRTPEVRIRDEDITSLHNKLKETGSVKDIFNI